MTETAEQRPISRILIALDASLKDLATLELAVALAARKQAELLTLFIEDQSLLYLAGLPFALEIDSASSRERKLDSYQMERALRSQAQQLTRALERLTEQLQLKYSLKVVRGSYMTEALAAVSGTDIIFLKRAVGHYKGRRKVQPDHFRHFPNGHFSISDAVWVIYNGSPESGRALSMACDIAMEKGRELIIILHPENPKQTREKERQAAAIIKDQIDHAHFVFTTALTDPTLMSMLQSKACGLLVMHRKDAMESDQLAKTFLEELECPLVLVL